MVVRAAEEARVSCGRRSDAMEAPRAASRPNGGPPGPRIDSRVDQPTYECPAVTVPLPDEGDVVRARQLVRPIDAGIRGFLAVDRCRAHCTIVVEPKTLRDEAVVVRRCNLLDEIETDTRRLQYQFTVTGPAAPTSRIAAGST